MNLYDIAIAKKLSGGGGGGGGGSSFTKIAETDIEANVTSSSVTELTTITLPESYKGKLIWVSVRDTAGMRAGYYYGSDTILSYTSYDGASTQVNKMGRIGYRCPSAGKTSLTQNRGIGPIGFTGTVITIGGQYYSSDTATINGTYHIEVYTLDWPSGESPFV